MVDKEKNTSQEDQNSMDWGDPEDQQQQTPDEPTDQEQQDQEQQEQEPQDPKQETPEQEAESEKPKDDVSEDSGQQNEKKCKKDDSVREELENQKWQNQIEQIESKCNQSLSDCLNKSNEDSLKLLNDVETAVNKYHDDFEKLKNQFGCLKSNNESALKDVQGSHLTEIDPIIDAAFQKIIDLEACKEKLECPVDGKGNGNNGGKNGDQEQDKPAGDEQVTPGEGDPVVFNDNEQVVTGNTEQGKPGDDDKGKDESDEGGKDEETLGGKEDQTKPVPDCDYSAYERDMLSKKPDVDLGCSDAERPKLMTLMTAKDKLERSGRYHDTMEVKFNEEKSTQATIEENLKKITDLQTKAKKAKDEGKKCQFSAYTLLIKKILEQTDNKLVKADVLNTKMSDALKKLVAAKKDKCYREYTYCKIEAMIELVKKTLEEAEKNRDQDILKKIVSTRT
jgi:hypothetical protein